jgi:predicted MFS family arabinose efflux permease
VSELPSPTSRLPTTVIFLMAAACAMAVATIYYNQPLLPLMAKSFGDSVGEIGKIATATQLGYALGLFLFVPLGDRVDRRRLIPLLLVCNMVGLVLCSAAPTLRIACIASFVLGLTAVTAQIIIPAASGLIAPEERGRTIAILLGGLSTGVLMSRSLSGLVGAELGWRAMFQVATALDVVLMAIVWWTLPKTVATTDASYFRLQASLWRLFVEDRVLRTACATGFLLFAAFSAFWSTMAALLARPPHGFGPAAAGAFGLLSAAGICASPTIGRLTDRFGPYAMLRVGVLVVTLAFGLLSWAEYSLWPIIVAVMLLDVGNRAGLVANQTRIFALGDQARSRLNTVFMSFVFLGGAAGSQVGQTVASLSGWHGLAATGAGFALLALLAQAAGFHVLAAQTVTVRGEFMTTYQMEKRLEPPPRR